MKVQMEMEYSESAEMYLKQIYRLSVTEKQIRATDVANALNVSKASVNRAVKRLCREGLLIHAKYGHIELTGQGNKKAQEICEKHAVITAYLIKALAIDSQQAETEACRLEHAAGEAVIRGMKQAMDSGIITDAALIKASFPMAYTVAKKNGR